MVVGPVSTLKLRKILVNNQNKSISKKDFNKTKVNYLRQNTRFKRLTNDFLDIDLTAEIDENLLKENKRLNDQKKVKMYRNANNTLSNSTEKPKEEKIISTVVYNKRKVDNGTLTKENTIFLSRILDFATTRPIEGIKDLETTVDIDYYCEPDKKITNEELYKLCKERPNIKYLDLSNCDKIMDWSPISTLKDLEQLDVNNCDYIIDLDFVKDLKKLKVLNAGNTDLRYIDGLESLDSLEIINLTSNPVLSIEPLKNCKNLHDIVLWGCLSVQDVSILKNCKELRLVDVESCPISDLSCLSNLTNLNTILMDNCSKVKDFSFLENLTELRYFSADAPIILGESNLYHFRNLKSIEYLSLKQRGIATLEYFKNFHNLKELKLVDNMIKDLKPIENLVEMQKIDLTKNKELKDLSPLHNMHKLEKLILNGSVPGGKTNTLQSSFDTMQITDLSVLQNFPNLKEINLDGNTKLKDISWFAYCPKLEEVQLNNCTQLEDATPLGDLEFMFRLEIKNCPKVRDLYCVSRCEALTQFNYNGTSVPTVKMINTLKRCTGIFILKGNDAVDIQSKFIKSGQKRIKMYKSRKKNKD